MPRDASLSGSGCDFFFSLGLDEHIYIFIYYVYTYIYFNDFFFYNLLIFFRNPWRITSAYDFWLGRTYRRLSNWISLAFVTLFYLRSFQMVEWRNGSSPSFLYACMFYFLELRQSFGCKYWQSFLLQLPFLFPLLMNLWHILGWSLICWYNGHSGDIIVRYGFEILRKFRFYWPSFRIYQLNTLSR